MSAVSRYSKRKRRTGFKIISWMIAVVIAAGVVMFLVADYYDNTKQKFEEYSYPRKYSEYVERAADEYDLEPALIYAVIRTESNFSPNAESNAGACGIMQVMPSSFEWLQSKRGCEGEYTTDDLFDPKICIDYGSFLLKYFYDLYGDEKSAVAAYNAGFVVGEWLSDSNYSTDGKTLLKIPYPETSDYVDKVESSKEMYINLYYS